MSWRPDTCPVVPTCGAAGRSCPLTSTCVDDDGASKDLEVAGSNVDDV